MEILVDNEIAVQNLLKMADHKGLTSSSTKTGDREYLVKIVAGASGEEALKKLEEETSLEPEKKTSAVEAWWLSSVQIIWERAIRFWVISF